MIPAGTTLPPAFPGSPSIGPLPAHCRVDGVINRRKGAGGEEFGIGFALALPKRRHGTGDFMMQGGGGGNGVVSYPLEHRTPATNLHLSADSRWPAQIRDTIEDGPFDFSFYARSTGVSRLRRFSPMPKWQEWRRRSSRSTTQSPRRIPTLSAARRRARRHDSVAALSHGF